MLVTGIGDNFYHHNVVTNMTVVQTAIKCKIEFLLKHMNSSYGVLWGKKMDQQKFTMTHLKIFSNWAVREKILKIN